MAAARAAEDSTRRPASLACGGAPPRPEASAPHRGRRLRAPAWRARYTHRGQRRRRRLPTIPNCSSSAPHPTAVPCVGVTPRGHTARLGTAAASTWAAPASGQGEHPEHPGRGARSAAGAQGAGYECPPGSQAEALLWRRQPRHVSTRARGAAAAGPPHRHTTTPHTRPAHVGHAHTGGHSTEHKSALSGGIAAACRNRQARLEPMEFTSPPMRVFSSSSPRARSTRARSHRAARTQHSSETSAAAWAPQRARASRPSDGEEGGRSAIAIAKFENWHWHWHWHWHWQN